MKKRHSRFAATLAVAALFLLAPGCNDGIPPVETSTEEATVSGKVTLQGKPATEGSVTFDPTNVMRKTAALRSGPIGEDGTYSVKTLIGENTVRVGGRQASKAGLDAGTKPFLVKPGENTFDITLP